MSAPKVSPAWSAGFFITLAVEVWVLFTPQAVGAQCDNPQPLCWTCHASEDPVVEQGEWHTIHALQKCCRACHGGNDRTDDQATAHTGMTRQPLDTSYLSCHQCHPDDYSQRADIVAVALGLTPRNPEPTARPPVVASTLAPPVATRLPHTSFQGWDWPVELAVAIVVLGLGVMRWRRVHSW